VPGENTENNFLLDEAYRNKLISLFKEYHDNLQDLIEIATIANDGNRPSALENEIYSSFHHISRSMFSKSTPEEARKELDKAENSHLTRVFYDSCKIIINSMLKQSSVIIQEFSIVIMDSDVRSIFPESINVISEITEIQHKVRKQYLVAKQHERDGNVDKAKQEYREIIELFPEIQSRIDKIRKDTRFNVALMSITKKERKERKHLKLVTTRVWIAGISAVTAIVAAIVSVFKFFC
jgi:hypothetical protein